MYSAHESAHLGNGHRTPAGALTNPVLADRLRAYRRRVASGYRSLRIEEIGQMHGPMFVAPKIDGELWCLVSDGTDVCLVNPRGVVIHGAVPVLDDARRLGLPPMVIAGELWATSTTGRPRVAGVAKACAGGTQAPVGRLRFAAFDIVQEAGEVAPYADRLATLRAVLDGGDLVACVDTVEVETAAEARTLYGQWVEADGGEGVVVRDASGTAKIKPSIDIDAAVIGYTCRADAPGQARSLLLAVRRGGAQYQIIGEVGSLGTDAQRLDLHERLSTLACPSTYRQADSDGAIYQAVRPQTVVQIRVNDVQAERTDGEAVRRMVLTTGIGGWSAVRAMPGVALVHPVLERIRDDKTASREEIRIEQVGLTDEAAEAVEQPASKLTRREVWTKASKGATAVRKLLVWRTNKGEGYPAWVVAWVDYSPGRAKPIQRTVRALPTEAAAHREAEALIAKGIKRGWDPVGPALALAA